MVLQHCTSTDRAAMTRRRVLLACTGAPAATWLAACRPQARPAAAPEGPGVATIREKVTIEVWNSDWGELYNDLMRKIGDELTKEQPSITVNWSFVSGIQDKLTAAIAGGSPPDAAYTNYVFQATLAAKGAFLALDDYLKASKLTRADFQPSMYDASLWKGKLYAIPGGADWIVFFWSKDVYSDAGLNPEQPPRTFQELEQHSLKVLKLEQDGSISRMGFVPGNFTYIAYLNGGEFYDAAQNKITANHPKNIEAMEWLLSYATRLDMNKVTAFRQGAPSYSRPGNYFATKKDAYLITGFWAYDPLDKYAPDLKYGITPWPTPTGSREEMRRNTVQGWMYAIPQNARHKDAAWVFIKYSFIDQSAKMGYLTLNGPCYLKQLDEFANKMRTEVLGPTNRMTPYFHIFLDVARLGEKHWPAIPVGASYSKAVNDAWNAVLKGEKTPRVALDEVTRQIQAELDAALK
jgi:ABC-type glycerol-3-phosphate transport system substrate-binding protein